MISACEYPLCDVSTPYRYCVTHERLLERLQAERETLYQSLNDIKPLVTNYWLLPISDQVRVCREAGMR
jgi:hypothetical protein